MKTVNVIEYTHETIQQLKAFPDDKKGNLAAENLFIKLIQENDMKDRSKFLGIDYYLEEGRYESGNGYGLYLVHST